MNHLWDDVISPRGVIYAHLHVWANSFFPHADIIHPCGSIYVYLCLHVYNAACSIYIFHLRSHAFLCSHTCNNYSCLFPAHSLTHAALIHHPGVFFFPPLSFHLGHLLPDHKGCGAQVAPVAVKVVGGASWEMDLTREKCRQLGGEAELTSSASRWTPLSPLFFHLQLLMLQLLGWTLL